MCTDIYVLKITKQNLGLLKSSTTPYFGPCMFKPFLNFKLIKSLTVMYMCTPQKQFSTLCFTSSKAPNPFAEAEYRKVLAKCRAHVYLFWWENENKNRGPLLCTQEISNGKNMSHTLYGTSILFLRSRAVDGII